MARLGLKLYFLRTRQLRQSQQAIARTIGVRQATISNIEQGASLPSCALLIELCRFFDVTPTFLLDDERGLEPLPTERWSMRNALATGSMWVETPPDAIQPTEDGQRLCPLLPGADFYDAEAAAVRREHGKNEAQTILGERTTRLREQAKQLEDDLERELRDRPQRRRRESDQHSAAQSE